MDRPIRRWTWEAALLLTTMVWAAIALLGAASPAAALTVEQPIATPFPRLAMWWPNPHTQSAADIARYDWVGMQNADSDHIAELRAANPDIKLFGSNSAQQLNYREDDYNDPLNVELRSAVADGPILNTL